MFFECGGVFIFCIILRVLLCFFWCCYFVFFFWVVLLCTLSPCALLLLGDQTFLWGGGTCPSCVEVKLPPLLFVGDITSPSSLCWMVQSSSLVLQHVVTHLFFVSPSHFFFCDPAEVSVQRVPQIEYPQQKKIPTSNKLLRDIFI